MDVYIALRSDGALGSGTEADPYSGVTLANQATSVSLSSIALGAINPDGISRVVTIQTGPDHNFKTGDLVLIEGVQASSGVPGYYFNGTFLITRLGPTSFSCTIFDTPAAVPVPITGSCRLDPYLFDAAMRRLPISIPVTVHLGPGIFETKGHSSPSDIVAWRPFSGMKLRGSGMSSTTLKLVGASFDHRAYHAIGCPELGSSPFGTGAPFSTLDGFEASDFCVDCAIASQPNQAVTCGAIFIRGQHTRLRRIRAINFGRQGTRELSPECFVFGVCGADFIKPQGVDAMEDVPDCVVEECIVEQPGLNNVKETTCIIGFEGDARLLLPPNPPIFRFLPAFQRATVVRNCLIDCQYQENAIAIASITINTITHVATVTTRGPHGLTANQWVRIDGAFLSGAADNAYCGAYQVASISGSPSTTFTYFPTDNVTGIPSQNPDPGSEMWVGRWPSHFVAIAMPGGVTGPVSTNPWVYTVATKTAHFLVPGSTVALGVVSAEGTPWNDAEWIVMAPDPMMDRRSLKIRRNSDPGVIPTGNAAANALIGVNFQAVSIGGSVGVMEGNTLMNCRYGGSRRDTSSLRDLVVRNNYYRNVFGGPANLIAQQSGLLTAPSALSRYPSVVGSETHYIAVYTVNSTQPHGLTAGQGIRVQHVKVGLVNPEANPFNGVYTIFRIDSPAALSFEYDMGLVDPGVSNLDLSQATLNVLWRFRDFLFENNVLELQPGRNDRISAVGVTLGAFSLPPGYTAGSHFTTRNAVIRNNIIRYLTGPSGSPVGSFSGLFGDFGMQVKYCEFALIENNVIDMPGADHPILYESCKNVSCFNNLKPSGQLVQGELGTTASAAIQQELTTLVDDALMLSFL